MLAPEQTHFASGSRYGCTEAIVDLLQEMRVELQSEGSLEGERILGKDTSSQNDGHKVFLQFITTSCSLHSILA